MALLVLVSVLTCSLVGTAIGARLLQLPMTPERVAAALRKT